jgi:hypothetical protein
MCSQMTPPSFGMFTIGDSKRFLCAVGIKLYSVTGRTSLCWLGQCLVVQLVGGS